MTHRFNHGGLPLPMKPAAGDKTIEELVELAYACRGEYTLEEKLDGISVRVKDGELFTATGKHVPNINLQKRFGGMPHGLCAEIVKFKTNADGLSVPCDLSETSGMCRSHLGDISNARLIMYDFWDDPEASYLERFRRVLCTLQEHDEENAIRAVNAWVHGAASTTDYAHHIKQFAVMMQDQDCEGLIFRANAPAYHYGRCTPTGNELCRHKFWEDFEAIVVSVNEMMVSSKQGSSSDYGYSKTSKRQEDLEPGGTFGNFTCHELGPSGAVIGTFTVGSGPGLTAEARAKIWRHRKSIEFAQPTIMCRRQKNGGKAGGAPRHPTFRSFRTRVPGYDDE